MELYTSYSVENGTYDVFDCDCKCVYYGSADEVLKWLSNNGYTLINTMASKL